MKRVWAMLLIGLLLIVGAALVVRFGQTEEEPPAPLATLESSEPVGSGSVASQPATRPDDAAPRVTPTPFREHERLPVVAGGRVVDASGNPVAGAWPQLGWTKAGDSPQAGAWPRVPGLQVRPSDETGWFEVRGQTAPGAFQIHAAKPGYWGENPREFGVGATDLVLRVHQGGSIEGSILLPDWVKAESVSVDVNLDDEGRREWKAQGSRLMQYLDENSAFTVEGLRAGPFTVTIAFRDGSMMLKEISDVMVKAGETTRDPRLQKLDLTTLGPPVVLTVVDAEGRSIDNAEAGEVGYPSRASSRGRRIRSDTGGKVKILLHARPADVAIGAWGYRRTVVTSVSSDRQVVLEKGIPVAITLSGHPLFHEEGITADAVLTFASVAGDRKGVVPEDLIGRSTGDTFTRDVARVTLPVGEPGGYKLDLYLVKNRRKSVQFASKLVVVADNLDAVQEFDIGPTKEEFDEGLRKLNAR